MSEPVDPADRSARVETELIGGLGMLRAMMSESTRPPRFEYIQVTWPMVNVHAADGYQLVPIPAVYNHNGAEAQLVYTMMRQLSVTDDATALLKSLTGHGPGPKAQS
jgi:hypothetical protein